MVDDGKRELGIKIFIKYVPDVVMCESCKFFKEITGEANQCRLIFHNTFETTRKSTCSLHDTKRSKP